MRRRYTVKSYRCPKDHSFSKVVADADRLKQQPCPQCHRKAEPTILLTRAALPPATVVYEKVVDGRVKRMYVSPQEPESVGYAEKQGFARREIQGLGEIRRFEREVCEEMRREVSERREYESALTEQRQRQMRDEYRDLQRQCDDPFMREVIQHAIDDLGNDRGNNATPDFRIAAYQ